MVATEIMPSLVPMALKVQKDLKVPLAQLVLVVMKVPKVPKAPKVKLVLEDYMDTTVLLEVPVLLETLVLKDLLGLQVLQAP